MRGMIFAYGVGLIFGIGLVLAGMTQPAKVIAFLDPVSGWDPSLAFVMVGAIAVQFVAYRVAPHLSKPLWAATFAIPTRKDIDARLVVGAVLFGAGWGLGGYCPGPALTSAASGAPPTLVFTASMLAGMWAFTLWDTTSARSASIPTKVPVS